jgi:hypothetical protein
MNEERMLRRIIRSRKPLNTFKMNFMIICFYLIINVGCVYDFIVLIVLYYC